MASSWSLAISALRSPEVEPSCDLRYHRVETQILGYLAFGTGEDVGRESLRDRPWLGIGGYSCKVGYICMGNSLSELCAGCFSLVPSSGCRNLMFLHLPGNLFLSSHHKRGMEFRRAQILKFERYNIERAFAHSRTKIYSKQCTGSWVSPGQPYSTLSCGYLRGRS